MNSINNYHIHFIFALLINFYLFPFSSGLLRSMKKISDEEDYFVIFDSGLFIYNFKKSKQINITSFNQTLFKERDENNRIVISKIEDNNEIKIAALINQHLFIYLYLWKF